MSVFKVDGVDLTGVRAGTGAPLLMLHGAGGPRSILAACDRLSKSFAVLAPTHPGFADCPQVERFDTVDDLAYLYLDLLDEMKLSDVTVMGFSLGGWIAAEMAVKSTARIGRIILVDAVGVKFGGPDSTELADLFSIPPSETPKLTYFDQKFAPDPSTFTDQDKLNAQRSFQAFARYAWEPYLHNPKLKQRLHRIDRPALLIWGEHDKIVDVDYGRKFCAAIPGARMVVLPNVGHVPQVEAAEKFDALVADFVNGRPSPIVGAAAE
jgi:pimeloyl-ACP methyl ester carboxylesterase